MIETISKIRLLLLTKKYEQIYPLASIIMSHILNFRHYLSLTSCKLRKQLKMLTYKTNFSLEIMIKDLISKVWGIEIRHPWGSTAYSWGEDSKMWQKLKAHSPHLCPKQSALTDNLTVRNLPESWRRWWRYTKPTRNALMKPYILLAIS